MRPRTLEFDLAGGDLEKVFPVDYLSGNPATISVVVTGTADYSVQQCFENILAGDTPSWSDLPSATTQTASGVYRADSNATAVKVVRNSHTLPATLIFSIVQAGSY